MNDEDVEEKVVGFGVGVELPEDDTHASFDFRLLLLLFRVLVLFFRFLPFFLALFLERRGWGCSGFGVGEREVRVEEVA